MSRIDADSAWIKRAVPWFLMATVIPAVTGFVTGWFVGGSSVPVAGALLPGFLAIVSAIGMGMIEHRWKQHELLVKVFSICESEKISPSTKARLEEVVGPGTSPPWIPYALTLSTLLFCGGLVVGAECGVWRRLNVYPPITEIIDNTTEIDPLARAQLQHLRWALQSQNIPFTDAKRIFDNVIDPILRCEVADSEDADLASLASRRSLLRKASQAIADITNNWKVSAGIKIPPSDYSSLQFRQALASSLDAHDLRVLLSVIKMQEDTFISNGPTVGLGMVADAIAETEAALDKTVFSKLQEATSILLHGTVADGNGAKGEKTVVHQSSSSWGPD